MACTNCSQTKTITPCSTGCASTMNTDCVIYDKEPLCFESTDVDDGDKRTLTDLLQLIQCGLTRESKILAFNTDGETDDADRYTIVEEDCNKILLFTCTDDGTAGTFTNTIVLPLTSEFINKELIFKDISVPSDRSVDFEYVFNTDIQYDWNPLTTSDEFATLMDSAHKTLKLRFVKVTPTSYQWIVCP